jgi:hypothetical protein
MNRDLYHNLARVHLLDPQDITVNDTSSNILDTQGFESAAILAIIGAITTPDSTSYLTPVLQESDTTADADFTDVAAGDIQGGFSKIDSATEDQTTQIAAYIGSKRYIRVKFDITDDDGGISNALVAAVGLLGVPRHAPATAPAAVAAT